MKLNWKYESNNRKKNEIIINLIQNTTIKKLEFKHLKIFIGVHTFIEPKTKPASNRKYMKLKKNKTQFITTIKNHKNDNKRQKWQLNRNAKYDNKRQLKRNGGSI